MPVIRAWPAWNVWVVPCEGARMWRSQFSLQGKHILLFPFSCCPIRSCASFTCTNWNKASRALLHPPQQTQHSSPATLKRTYCRQNRKCALTLTLTNRLWSEMYWWSGQKKSMKSILFTLKHSNFFFSLKQLMTVLETRRQFMDFINLALWINMCWLLILYLDWAACHTVPVIR